MYPVSAFTAGVVEGTSFESVGIPPPRPLSKHTCFLNSSGIIGAAPPINKQA